MRVEMRIDTDQARRLTQGTTDAPPVAGRHRMVATDDQRTVAGKNGRSRGIGVIAQKDAQCCGRRLRHSHFPPFRGKAVMAENRGRTSLS